MGDLVKMHGDNVVLLRQAVLHDQIVPYFQPIIALRSGRLAGFEVLARWSHPNHSLLPPADFIPLAEENGLIDQLTERLLLAACTEAAAWPDDLFLSFNLSPRSLRTHSVVERLHGIAERTGYPTSRLVCEITEGALIENSEMTREVIGELKALDIQIAQDDFGTGYSSLRQLQSLPCDKLKIDASFIRSMTYHRPSRKIVAAVVGLGLSLGLGIVAEGIETQQQADMLAGLGCDYGQGWWFGRPVPAAEASRGVAAGRWTRAGVDLTARMASEIALRLEASPCRRLAQLRALYDGAPVGLALLDRELHYLSLNRKLADMHGIPVEAHIGHPMRDVAPDLFRVVEPHLRRVLHGEPVNEVRIPWKTADTPDAEHLYAVSYHPVHDEADEIIGISVAVIDITDSRPAAADVLAAGLRAVDGDTRTRLTKRQEDVMRLLAEGWSVKEIARELKLGTGTVKVHLARAYRSLGARNRIEAINLLRRSCHPAAA